MRILVHEFASGGGLAGRAVPTTIGREGRAMRDALVADLAAIGRHRILATVDPRFPLAPPSGVEAVPIPPAPAEGAARLDTVIAGAEAVWLVAPETSGCLEALAARIERMGKPLLGSGSRAIRRAADKAALARRLGLRGIPHPATRVVACGASRAGWEAAASALGYPVVVKPRRGAGSEGVRLARDAAGLFAAMKAAAQVAPDEPLLLQSYIPGVAASASLLVAGSRATPLALNRQALGPETSFEYEGGATPLDHPLSVRALEVAASAAEGLSGLRGWVGVDLVLTDSEAVVIEVNPRLTTAYLGVRSSLDANVAALALDACEGALPGSIPLRDRVCFTSAGRILSAVPIGDVAQPALASSRE